MKQLSIRLLAPIAIAGFLVLRFAQLITKSFVLFFTLPQCLIGRWRLYLNYCPECNSCAPKMHECEVCQADTKAFFQWSEETKKTWWKRYTEKHHMAI